MYQKMDVSMLKETLVKFTTVNFLQNSRAP